MKRRTFLLLGTAGVGALVVGWGMLPPRQRLLPKDEPFKTAPGEVALNGWIKISSNGAVTLALARAEMGQGVSTALPMLLAEELGCDWGSVRVVEAPLDSIYANAEVWVDSLPFHPDNDGSMRRGADWVVRKVGRMLGLSVTGGSSSVKDAWEPLRIAGASAREMLVQAAAQTFSVPASECKVMNGFVVAGAKRAAFGDLAEAAAKFTPNMKPALKDPKDFNIIGRIVPRVDVPAKVNGKAQYGIDVREAGQLYAAIRMMPAIHKDATAAGIAAFDGKAAEGKPGVRLVTKLDAGMGGMHPAVAVVADTYWQAKTALDAVTVQWGTPKSNLSSADITQTLKQALAANDGTGYHSVGKVSDDLNGAAKRVEAEYSVPLLAHATMEPMNTTALYRDNGTLEVWSPTQVSSIARWMLSRALDIKQSAITLHVTQLGGGFGRRLEVDMILQAAELARRLPNKPVQLIWSREEDMTHDVYRPAALAKLSGGLDAQGNITALDVGLASGSVTHSVFGRLKLPAGGPDKTNAEGIADTPYEFANVRVRHTTVESPLQLGYWRSVGHSHNAFFMENFIDELARAAGKDPVQFRMSLLKNHPRHAAVLAMAAGKAGWGTPTPQGMARGVALHESFGSIVAQVADVSITPEKKIRVHRVVAAVDCGIAVNPSIIAQQMESGVIFGLTAALFGEITVKDGQVEQKNFPQYDMLRMADSPVVETHIIKSSRKPAGMGEPGTPPIAPAVASALFQLTGKRVRKLPIRLSDLV